MQADDQMREAAAGWAVRVSDPAFADWDAFTAWLEADPRHAAAYDAVVLAVDDAAAALALVPAVANDDVPVPAAWTRRRWIGGAMAAALVGVLVFTLWGGGSQTYQTAPGETQLVELADGSTIMLAGGTSLELTGERTVDLAHGQALFTVVHDDAAPFVVTAGADRLVDIGTVFDVKLGRAGLELGVSEGAVVFNPDNQDLRVDAGNRLVSPVGGRAVVAPIDPALVGEWREGRLTFDLATLDTVAEDLTRATGIAFAANGVGTVSGSLLVAPVAEDPRVLEELLGVRVRRSGDGWELAGR